MVFTEAKSAASPFKSLTLRELQMLQMISEGKPYGVIAQELNVSYKTVANTCSMRKAFEFLSLSNAAVTADVQSSASAGPIAKSCIETTKAYRMERTAVPPRI